jgi:hypothetical protein
MRTKADIRRPLELMGSRPNPALLAPHEVGNPADA